ncbi:autotransporter domain-containing protein [Campylobacter sp. MOP51]|uniref:autotransporter outer membrane beta-barrel domain-containing protein n=1 Tax=Campylobacter canis TaxID=3378588 RepID=UPI003C30FD7A
MKFSKIAAAAAISLCLSTQLAAHTYLEDIRTGFLQYIEGGGNLRNDDPVFKIVLIDYILALSTDEKSSIAGGINSENDIKFITEYLDKSYNLVTELFEINFKKPLEKMINSSNIDSNKLEEINRQISHRTFIFKLNGRIVDGTTSKLTEEDIKNHSEELKDIIDNFMIEKRKKLLANVEHFKNLVKKKIAELKEQGGANQAEIEQAEEWLRKAEKNQSIITKEIQEDNTKDIINIANKRLKDSDAKDIVNSLYDALSSNEQLRNTLSTLSATQIIDLSKDISSSVKSVVDNINKSSQIEAVKFNTELATQTRLAKLSNPFNDNLALAYAIKNLNSVGAFASNDNEVLSSIIKHYTDRFNYDNNLWGTILGGKAKFENNTDSSIYGFTLGYDKAFDNTIVGGYATYAKSKIDNDKFNNKADSYQAGVYTRHYIQNSEIDTKISIGKAKNKLERNISSPIGTLSQNGKYNTTFASIDVDYGYVFSLQNSSDKFIKPFIGVSYSHLKNKAFKESGALPLAFNPTTSKILSLNTGVEFRKYIENGKYFYIAPSVEKELYKHSDDTIVRFVGSKKDLIFKAGNKKNTYFKLEGGAELNLTHNLSTNINLGIKAKSKEKFYNGTIGLRYKF